MASSATALKDGTPQQIYESVRSYALSYGRTALMDSEYYADPNIAECLQLKTDAATQLHIATGAAYGRLRAGSQVEFFNFDRQYRKAMDLFNELNNLALVEIDNGRCELPRFQERK